MRLTVMTMALFLIAAQAFGQQSTTNCLVNGQWVNCTTTTTTTTGGSILDSIANPTRTSADREKPDANQKQNLQSVQQSPQLSAEAIKELLAQEKMEREAEKEAQDTVDFIYCRRSPKGGLPDSDGKPRTCADVLEYTKAFCSVNPEKERCNLARSKAEVEKAFAALLDEYNKNAHRNGKWEQAYFGEKFDKLTKWGCMSFPDMTLPQRNGMSHPCPDASETAPLPADAGSKQK
jgi:hypothetical protein